MRRTGVSAVSASKGNKPAGITGVKAGWRRLACVAIRRYRLSPGSISWTVSSLTILRGPWRHLARVRIVTAPTRGFLTAYLSPSAPGAVTTPGSEVERDSGGGWTTCGRHPCAISWLLLCLSGVMVPAGFTLLHPVHVDLQWYRVLHVLAHRRVRRSGASGESEHR